MAIAFDAFTDGGFTAGSSPLVYAHNNSGNFVVVGIQSASGGGSTGVTGVTYNGSAMTKIFGMAGPNLDYFWLWYLENAPTGNNNVSIAFTSAYVAAVSTSYSGVATTGALDTSNSAQIADTSQIDTPMIAAGAGECIITLIATSGALATDQPLSSGTARGVEAAVGYDWLFDKLNVGAGSVTITGQATGSGQNIIMLSALIKPPGAAGTATSNLTLLRA